ncbi:MAG: radical SAM protein [Candidatus Electrothrix sp. AW3_4]|nr:radical SAM protein [Candidatus Electrothrix gigas]
MNTLSPTTSIPRLSTEIYSIPLDDNRYLIYAPLHGSALLTDAAEADLLNTVPAGTNIDLLRRLHSINDVAESPPLRKMSGPPLPTAITLLLTTACNLRCSYCYASAGARQAEFMPLETAKRGIDFITANAKKKNAIARNVGQQGVNELKVAYHGGGEPSLHWQMLTASFAYAQQKAENAGLRVSGSMISNGVLGDDRIDWIIANMDKVTISFDGLPSIQDQQRPTKSGRGSSSAVMHTLRRLDAAGFPYVIRMSATEAYLEQLADAVTFIGQQFQPQRIQIEPVYPMGRGQTMPSVTTSRFIQAYREARTVAKKWHVKLDYSASRLDKLSHHFCGVTQDAFSLTAAGNVTACHSCFAENDSLAKVFLYGKPHEHRQGYQFDMPVLEKLRNRAIQHPDGCQDCFAKWHCAGGCYYYALHANETGQSGGSARCRITRALLVDEILEHLSTLTGGT